MYRKLSYVILLPFSQDQLGFLSVLTDINLTVIAQLAYKNHIAHPPSSYPTTSAYDSFLREVSAAILALDNMVDEKLGWLLDFLVSEEATVIITMASRH